MPNPFTLDDLGKRIPKVACAAPPPSPGTAAALHLFKQEVLCAVLRLSSNILGQSEEVKSKVDAIVEGQLRALLDGYSLRE
jgi:hypothetical protein